MTPPRSTLRHRALCRTCQLPQSLGCADTSSAQQLCRLAQRGYVRLRGMERHWDSSRAYAIFSFSGLAASGVRSGTLLLVPSSTTHQEDSDGLTSSVEQLCVGSEDFEEGQLLWTSLLLVWPKSQRKGTQRHRLKDRKSPFAREGCAGQCATVIFRQFMELLLPHLLMNGTAVSFKHRQCAANSLLFGVIVRTVQMARDHRAETVRGALPHSVTSGARVFVFS